MAGVPRDPRPSTQGFPLAAWTLPALASPLSGPPQACAGSDGCGPGPRPQLPVSTTQELRVSLVRRALRMSYSGAYHIRQDTGVRLHVPDALIAVSDAVAQALVEGGLPQSRIVVVRSGIALHEAPSEAETMGLREGLGISSHDSVLGVVAHVLPPKGYDDLIHGLPLLQGKLPHVKCLIVGGAPRERYLQKLLQLAQHLSARVRLIVARFQEDVAPFLHSMDALFCRHGPKACPSRSWKPWPQASRWSPRQSEEFHQRSSVRVSPVSSPRRANLVASPRP